MTAAKKTPEGLVLSRKNRLIGVEVSLVYLPNEDPSCRWQTECDHGNCVGHKTRKLGESFVSVPWEWCDVCDAAKKAKEAPAKHPEQEEDLLRRNTIEACSRKLSTPSKIDGSGWTTPTTGVRLFTP